VKSPNIFDNVWTSIQKRLVQTILRPHRQRISFWGTIMLRRTIAAAIWVFFAFASALSFEANHDPKWYDYASAGPLLIVLIALIFGHDRFLIEELNGWLAKLRGPKDGQGNDPQQ
jgi:hypothetical protein